MCDVFGKEENMQKYVEELGSTSLCKVSDGAGCSDKEKEFILKWKGSSDIAAQLARLQGMTGSSMKVCSRERARPTHALRPPRHFLAAPIC